MVRRGSIVVFALLLLIPTISFASAASVGSFQFEVNEQPLEYISPLHEQLVDLTFEFDATAGYVLLDLSSMHVDPAKANALKNRQVLLSSCETAAARQEREWAAEHNDTNETMPDLTQSTKHYCTLSNLAIQPQNASNLITYRINQAGQLITGNVTFTFQLDDSPPEVVDMMTEICDENRCLIGNNVPTNVTIDLDDSTGTFHAHKIYFQIGGQMARAESCDGTTCTGTITVPCNDNDRLDMKVISSATTRSTDDAGNEVINPGEVYRVVCDSQPPEVLNVTYKGTGLRDLVQEDGSLVITAFVDEAVSAVTMSADTEHIQFNASENASEEIECESTEMGIKKCQLSIGELDDGRNLLVPLHFTDQLGNTAEYRLTVPSILAVVNASTAPNFFTAEATNVAPKQINRVALQLALDNAIDYPHFINYRLSRMSSNARIIQQEVKYSSCEWVKHPESGSDLFGPAPEENWTAAPDLYIADAAGNLRVFYPNADWDVENRIDASFLRQETAKLDMDVIRVRCNLSLIVEKNNQIYELPEVETLYWPIILRNAPLGSPGDAFLKKIDEQQEKMDGSLFKLIETAHQITSTMAHICNVQNVLNQAANLFNVNEGIFRGASNAGVAALEGPKQAAMKSGKAIEETEKKCWTSDVPEAKRTKDTYPGGPCRKMCDYLHCRTGEDINKAINEAGDEGASSSEGEGTGGNWLLTGGSSGGWSEFGESDPNAEGGTSGLAGSNAVGEYFTNLNTPNVENSLIMSLATKCWSGVVYNLNKYRQVECGYLLCLKEQALAGHSVAVCEEARGVQLCRQILGEVFELPYARTVKNLMGNINRMIQSPFGILINYIDKGPCGTRKKEDSWPGFGCRLLVTFKYVEDFQAMSRSNLYFGYPYQADLCQRATCEGEDCNLETSSFVEQMIPGTGYVGDVFRADAYNHWDAAKNRQTGGSAESTGSTTASTTSQSPSYTDRTTNTLYVNDPVAGTITPRNADGSMGSSVQADTWFAQHSGVSRNDFRSESQSESSGPRRDIDTKFWTNYLGSQMINYLREKGLLENLYIKSWGSLGEDLSAFGDQYLNTDRMINDACNPAGAFSDYTEDDGSVYLWQGDFYRSVLTFAGEILPIGERANGGGSQYLYTVSAVIVGVNEDDNYTITLEPGDRRVVANTITQNVVESVSKAVNDSVEYKEVCVTFKKDFPQPGGDRRFCRSIEPSAYDRGAVTNATLPEFGQDDPMHDPYDTWKSALGSTGSTGTTRTGMMGGGS